MDDYSRREKARILKEALRIVDLLGDFDEDNFSKNNILYDIIVKAKKLKKSREWRL